MIIPKKGPSSNLEKHYFMSDPDSQENECSFEIVQQNSSAPKNKYQMELERLVKMNKSLLEDNRFLESKWQKEFDEKNKLL